MSDFNEQKVRAEFEQWFGSTVKLTRDPNGYYEYMAAHSAWHAYLAGREAQQREDAAEIERLKASSDGYDKSTTYWHNNWKDEKEAARKIFLELEATITQLQAQLAAVKGGEPVGYVCMGVNGHKYGAFTCDVPQQAKLYLAPPAAQVPDGCDREWRGGDSYQDGEHNGYEIGWNACREAMPAASAFQGRQTGRNRPDIPTDAGVPSRGDAVDGDG